MSRFASLLVENQIVTIAVIEKALHRQVIRGGHLSTNLLEMDAASEEILTAMYARDLAMEPAPIERCKDILLEALAAVPLAQIQQSRILPYAMSQDTLDVAVDAPAIASSVSGIEFLLGLRVVPRIVLPYRLAISLARNLGIPPAARFISLAKRIDPDFDPGLPPRIQDRLDRSRVIDGNDPRPKAEPTSPPAVIGGRIITLVQQPRTTQPPPAPRIPDATPPPSLLELTPIAAAQGLSLEEARASMKAADNRHLILRTALSFCRRWFSYTAIFVLQDKEAQGWRALSDQEGEIAIDPIAITVSGDGLFAQAALGAPAVGPPRKDHGDIEALRALQRRPRMFLVAPVLVRARPVLLFYGDRGKENISYEAAADVAAFLAMVGEALEGLIRKRKLGGYRKPEPMAGPSRPGKLPSTSTLAAALDNVRKRTPQDAHTSPAKPKPAASEPEPVLRRALTETRTTAPGVPAFRDVPAFADPVERLAGVDALDDPLVTHVASGGRRFLPDLIRCFPGKILLDRSRKGSVTASVESRGPLVRALALLGDQALPDILLLLQSPSSDVRYHALGLVSRFRRADVLESLIPLLFDPDPQVRNESLKAVKAMDALDGFAGHVASIREKLTMGQVDIETRRAAAAALGEILDPGSVPHLARNLGGHDPVLAERCHRALVKITAHDFGFNEQRWIAWFESHQGQKRIEWLIEGLLDRQDIPRRTAVEELSRVTGQPVCLAARPTIREREEAYRSMRAWYEQVGRSIVTGWAT